MEDKLKELDSLIKIDENVSAGCSKAYVSFNNFIE